MLPKPYSTELWTEATGRIARGLIRLGLRFLEAAVAMFPKKGLTQGGSHDIVQKSDLLIELSRTPVP